MATTGDRILSTLKQAGYKFTGKRKEIVNLFVQNPGRYMSARDVFDAVSRAFPTISFDTVYRTLTLLEEHNLVERSEFHDDAVRYRLTCQPQHHHHLICLGCGKTTVVNDCPMETLQTDALNFEVVDHRFELYGYCAACHN